MSFVVESKVQKITSTVVPGVEMFPTDRFMGSKHVLAVLMSAGVGWGGPVWSSTL